LQKDFIKSDGGAKQYFARAIQENFPIVTGTGKSVYLQKIYLEGY